MKTVFSFPSEDETVKKKMTVEEALNHVKTHAYFHIDDIHSLLDFLFHYGFIIRLGEHCYIAENEEYMIRIDNNGNGEIVKKGGNNA
ncbi:hypothetical protein [Acidianus bottle-shaped virus 3 strain ABV3]|uniref:Uncharacterized protein n=1 Tax=Acidianus bottle-shaped virus 3 strain ABV3 TaxID=1732174 RepID=A0A0N9NJK2_9VIRU|nr:hypothetical protein AVU00_gp32 [Acidianus bottle-shaped virus 3 strain ABV3]ALG96834.1 hypothetical protein [Acidianus bottle-shaped virus 3 strain ABV3]